MASSLITSVSSHFVFDNQHQQRGSIMMKTLCKRQGSRVNASYLTKSPAAPGVKRCACGFAGAPPPSATSSSKRNNNGEFAARDEPRHNHSDPSHQALARKASFQRKNYPSRSQRFKSAVAYSAPLSCVENTPLDSPEGSALLRGLDVHTVHAEDDGHPLAVYTIEGNDETGDAQQRNRRTPVLLLHGRTWSSVSVYHLAGGGGRAAGGGEEDRSLLRALHETGRVQPYAVDFRGFGGTPKDESGFVEPLRCVSDAVSVLNWICERRDESGSRDSRPALLGWSHGALIAQITAQRHADALSKLILYGSTYNPNVKYSVPSPWEPEPDLPPKGHTDHDDFPLHEMAARNEYDGAMEDFTNAPPVSAKLFAEAALVSDPIKAQWWNLHQLNECHPSLVNVPTMVISGDQDPYAPVQTQMELFTNLGKGMDRVWSIIANADHAVHLSDERHRFVENVNNFLETHVR